MNARIAKLNQMQDLPCPSARQNELLEEEKKDIISALDQTKLEIDFIKHDLAHVYCLKSKFKIDYSRLVPIHLFNNCEPEQIYLHSGSSMVLGQPIQEEAG